MTNETRTVEFFHDGEIYYADCDVFLVEKVINKKTETLCRLDIISITDFGGIPVDETYELKSSAIAAVTTYQNSENRDRMLS